MYKRKCFVGKRQFYRRVAVGMQSMVNEIYNDSLHQPNNITVETLCDTTDAVDNNVDNNVNVSYCNSPILDNDSDELQCLSDEHTENDQQICETGVFSDELDNKHAKSDLRSSLVHWATTKHISQSALTDLLHSLSTFHPDLPLDARTLLHTPTSSLEKTLDNGVYIHIGLKSGLNNLLSRLNDLTAIKNNIQLSFNVDGLPLFHSNNTQLWPILCIVKNIEDISATPFVVGLFCGKSKPSPLHSFLQDFINEFSDLLKYGFLFRNTVYHVVIHSFICDAPARAYIKGTKSHGGYSSCDKCTEEGEYHGRVVFLETSANKRTDESFKLQQDENHHMRVSPLVQLEIGMVTKFPVDYMHAVCLGVTKKLLNIWISGPLTVRLSHPFVSRISQHLELCKKYIPLEFNRKPRSLGELARWKATEFRTFLIYAGPVVLRDILDVAIYEHFLLLHSAITVYLSSRHISVLGTTTAASFIDIFINHSKRIYGVEFLVYNVHILCHLEDDVKAFGPLDNFSAFPYENFLGKLKKLVRSPINPAAQIFKRLKEKSALSEPEVFIKKNVEYFWEHTMGPVLEELNIWRQYKEIKFKNYSFCIKRYSAADSYLILKDNRIVQIENIVISSEKSTLLIGKEFMEYKSYYKYPMDSMNINICIIKKPSVLNVWSLRDALAKCLVLPFDLSEEEFVCFPLVHTFL